MVNSRASGVWEIIEKYESAGAESSKTFTFSAKDDDKYSEIVLVLSLEATAALDIEIVINGLTGSEYDDWASIMNGVITTWAVNNNQAEWDLGTIAAAARTMHAEIHFMLNDAHGTIAMQGLLTQPESGTSTVIGGRQDTGSQTEFTILKIQTSTSTWKTGSKATLYGIKR